MAVGAIIGEMVGDWMIDDHIQAKINSGEISPGTPEYNKILNTARLTAGSIALLYDFDVDVATQSAEHAVKNNSVKVITTTFKIGVKLVKIALKNNKVTINDLKKTLKDEGFDIVDNLITLSDGHLNTDDAKAIIDLVVGTQLNTSNKGQAQEKIHDLLMRNNPAKFLYNGIKNSPNYPAGFVDVQNGTKKHTLKDKETLDMLRTAVSGEWHKVYKDGYLNGQKVSIHYFQHKSGKVFNVKVKNGWSNKR